MMASVGCGDGETGMLSHIVKRSNRHIILKVVLTRAFKIKDTFPESILHMSHIIATLFQKTENSLNVSQLEIINK